MVYIYRQIVKAPIRQQKAVPIKQKSLRNEEKIMKNKILVVLLTFCMIAAMAVTAMAGDAAAAASVNGVEFASLADAITAAQAGDTIVLVNTVELENAIEIPSGKTITLDLNGNTVTYNSTTQGEAMITNRGSLTINDSVGTGVINYNYTGAADSSYSKGNYTISNAGNLTVNGGKITIANLSGHAKYPIDNNSTSGNAVLVINGGHLYNYNTSAIRQFCNSTTNTNSVTINGGLIEGYCAIWIQNPGSKTVNGSLSITGGEIRSTAKAWVNGTSELKDVGSAIYCTIAGAGGAWSEDSAVSITGGTINENVSLLENAPAEINIGKGATYNGYVIPTYVAQIGDKGYATLQAAVDDAQDGETIILINNITITASTAGYTDGTYTDGVRYTGDKSFTINFNGMTVTDDGCVNDYLIYLNNKGAKANEITFENGTIVSKNGCWSTVCVNGSAATQASVLNLNGMNITNSNDATYSGNPTVRARNKATINVDAFTVITSDGASYGIACSTSDSVINIKSGATVVQKNSGTSGGNSVFAAVGGKGVINIYDGATITSDLYGVHTMTTGTPVVNVYGGAITAPVALKSSTNGGTGELATINVTGGTINGALETYTNNGHIVVTGGTFSEAVDEKYCAEGYISIKNTNGTYGVTKAPVETPKETVENIVDNIISDNSNLTTEQQEAVQDTVEEAAQEIQSNEALLDESYQPVEDHSDVEELEITLIDMDVEVDGTNNTTTTEITYNVEPKDENGNKVSQPSQPITFRLPVPSSITGTYIEVYHEGSYYGMFEIKGTAPNRYVEITASNFSEWTLVGTEATPVAKIGDVTFGTLKDAFANAQDGDIIQLLPGTIEEGTIKLPSSLKNVTIKGATGQTSILKDMTIMAADGNSIIYEGLTFDGIVFENSRISITGWRTGEVSVNNLTVTNCVFQNLNDTTNSAPVHINMDASEAIKNFTFTNNTIDGATGGSKSGIYGQFTGNVTVKNNTINNVAFRPYVIQITTDDGIADTFTVTGNTFSGSAAGRAQGLGNNAAGTDTVNLVVSNNIFKDITNAQQICYWNFNADKTTADLSENYYDIDVEAHPDRIYYNSPAQNVEDLIDIGIYPYYTELTASGSIDTSSAKDEPTIKVVYSDNTVEYFSEILEAVPYKTNYPKLEGAKIILLDDISGAGIRLMENGMELDLNGHTYTITAGTGSQGTNTSGFQIRPEVTETVTIKNGTIQVAAGAPVVWMFNNYATNFVVDDVIVDCTNMAWSYGDKCYVLVSRAEDSATFKGNTEIRNFNSQAAGDMMSNAGALTIAESVKLGNSSIMLDSTGNSSVSGPEGLNVVTDPNHAVVYNNGVYTVTAAVAKIDVTGYKSLSDAIAASKAGDTIVLLADVTVEGAMTTAAIIDDNGHKLTLAANAVLTTVSGDLNVDVVDGYVLRTHVDGNGNTVYSTLPLYTVTFNVLPIQPTIILTDANGNEITPIVPGTYELIDGTYSFLMLQNGFIPKTGTFTVAGEDMTLDVIIYLYIPQNPTYSNVIDEAPHGDVTVTPARAEKGDTVVIIADPDAGYEVSRVSVTDKNGKPVSVVVNRDGTFSFIQPANNVTVSVTFTEIKAPAIEDTDDTVESLFIDVDADAYYAEAVLWAVEKGITTGTSDITFSPNATCTRAQAVTFLWRAAGSPAPKSTEMPFDDVDEDAYYAKAILWAVEKGITNGTSDTTFSPNAECTRAQIVTFLYRSQKSPDAASKNPFTDVDENAYYAEAVLWAVDNKITKGATVTTFAPGAECTRAQIVTFLYRCMGEE